MATDLRPRVRVAFWEPRRGRPKPPDFEVPFFIAAEDESTLTLSHDPQPGPVHERDEVLRRSGRHWYSSGIRADLRRLS